MKELKNLANAKILSKKEQLSVIGGLWDDFPRCPPPCKEGYECVNGICLPIPV